MITFLFWFEQKIKSTMRKLVGTLEVPLEDLSTTVKLAKNANEYETSTTLCDCKTIQCKTPRKCVRKGDTVSFIYTTGVHGTKKMKRHTLWMRQEN